VVKYGRHCVKQKARTRVHLNAERKARGKDNKTGNYRDKRVKKYDIQRFAEQWVILVNIATENRHCADTQTKRKERLIHRADNDVSVYLGYIGDKVEF